MLSILLMHKMAAYWYLVCVPFIKSCIPLAHASLKPYSMQNNNIQLANIILCVGKYTGIRDGFLVIIKFLVLKRLLEIVMQANQIAWQLLYSTQVLQNRYMPFHYYRHSDVWLYVNKAEPIIIMLKIYLLFFPEFPKILTHHSYFIFLFPYINYYSYLLL